MKTSIGLCGATGKTPELQIGQVKTVEHTQKASVEITGTREKPILNFNIPKGKDGAKLIVREYFNGDIQILNNLNELPQDTNSDSYGKTVMSVNGIKQLLEKINGVLTKANANTNALGSLTSTVQGNKSDIETKLNNFKSETDTKVQSINQSISELEQTIETKLNEELTKQVKTLQDENKNLKDKLLSTLIYVDKQGEEIQEDTTKAPIKNILIEGKTVVTDAPTETNTNYKIIESVGESEGNKLIVNVLKDVWFDKQYTPNSYINANGEIVVENGNMRQNCVSDFIKVDENKKYVRNGVNKVCYTIAFYDENKTFINRIGSANDTDPQTFTTPKNCKYVRFKFYNEIEGDVSKIYLREIDFNADVNLPIENGLKSLPDGTKDTIEQRQDGFYLVQRVGKVILNGVDNEDWTHIATAPNYTLVYHRFNAKRINVQPLCYPFLNNQLPYSNIKLDKIEQEGCYTAQDGNICVSILNDKLDTPDGDGFKKWLQQNNMIGYYVLAKPIETKISDIELETVGGINYITTENKINPNLKMSVSKSIKSYIDEKIGGTK